MIAENIALQKTAINDYMRFAAIDCETANADLASICQIGIAIFEDGNFKNSWDTLINPEDVFDPFNIRIHNITSQSVLNSPTFKDVYAELTSFLDSQIVVCHTMFDRSAVNATCIKYNLPFITCRWLDSSTIVRRTWPEFSQRGYILKNVARHLGIQFEHHVAVEDARTAGEIVIHAVRHSGNDIDQWLNNIHGSLSPRETIAQKGKSDGPLFGEEIVFTGRLSIERREAAKLAALAGCNVVDTVKKSTTLLVVGDQDVRNLGDNDKSRKHRKAEELINNGQDIRILTEKDFLNITAIEKIEPADIAAAFNPPKQCANCGITLSLGPCKPIDADPTANQEHPRRHYVYAHLDENDSVFFIGRGTSRDAWNDKRHPVWMRYVEKHLNGSYRVLILCDNLSPEEAGEIKDNWLSRMDPDSLVNWVNYYRPVDMEANERLHTLSDKNQQLIQDAKRIEKTGSLEQAVAMYVQAIEAIMEYASIQDDTGLIARLEQEENDELGLRGEVGALDRLTICLIKLNRPQEGAKRVEDYFMTYRRDRQTSTAKRICARIAKAMMRGDNSAGVQGDIVI